MKRAFVVGRRQGGRTMLLVLEPVAADMPGPWTIEVVVSR
jgi:hypothetical protein